jgi:phage terminase small subunit
MAGRPPKPAELKRAAGRTSSTDSGGRKLPDLSVVTILPMADSVPTAPDHLGVDGVRFWERAWNQAITWLSPNSDREAIENAAILADAAAAARKKYLATLESADARAFVAVNKAFTDSLASLGFDPVSRSRLGIAEVKRVSKLEELAQARKSKG